MASTSSSLQTPIFTGKNYEYWSLTMKDLFRGQYVQEIVQHGYVEPTDMTAYNNLTQAEKGCLEGTEEERWKSSILHTSSYA